MSSTPPVIAWAESPPSGRTAIVAPAAQRQAEGWVENRPLSAEEINWLWNAVGGVTQRVAKFTAQETAASTLSAGMSCILDEDSEDTPFAQEGFVFNGGGGDGTMDVDSQHVYYCRGNYGERWDREPSGGAPTNRIQYDASGSPTNSNAIVSDGETVFMAVDNRVVAFNAATATQLWDYDHGAEVHDIALVNDTHLVLGGALGTGNVHVRVLSKAAGAASGTYQHSASGAVYAVASNGRQVFIAGDASSYSSGATIRGLIVLGSVLRDEAGEGPNTASTAGMAWDDASFGTTLRKGCLACDRKRLTVIHPQTKLVQVELRSVADGRVLQSRQIAEEPRGVTMDHSFVYVACADTIGSGAVGCCEVYALPELAYCHRIYSDGSVSGGGASNEGVMGIASDGTAVFLNQVGHSIITRHRVPAGSRMWARVDATERQHPPHQQLIPTWGA